MKASPEEGVTVCTGKYCLPVRRALLILDCDHSTTQLSTK
jgi:hypothetical protein